MEIRVLAETAAGPRKIAADLFKPKQKRGLQSCYSVIRLPGACRERHKYALDDNVGMPDIQMLSRQNVQLSNNPCCLCGATGLRTAGLHA